MSDNDNTINRSIPELDRAALHAADFMFLQVDGQPAQRVRAAVFAYLYAAANREPFGESMHSYPSPAETAAAYARATADSAESDIR